MAGTVRTYDAIGNTLSIGGTAREFVYDANGRMAQAKRAGAVAMNYQYNGRGEQVRKFLGTTGTYTLYDETGHWLGDYDSTDQGWPDRKGNVWVPTGTGGSAHGGPHGDVQKREGATLMSIPVEKREEENNAKYTGD